MSGKKRTILLIDDEDDLVEAVSFQLKVTRGYEVVTACDGVDGLEKLKELSPDLIILDMNMPRMGGIEFYKNIADPKGKAQYPVLVLTARANLEQLFKDLNVDGFMCKPFDINKLMEQVDVIIEKRSGKPQTEKTDHVRIEKIRTKSAIERSKKILLAESDKELFDKIAITFLNEGFSVITANDGMTAIERAVGDTPDVLLINVGLDELPGDLVISRLKQMPQTMDIVFVLYSGEGRDLDGLVLKKICDRVGIELTVSTDPVTLFKKVKEMLLKKEGKS